MQFATWNVNSLNIRLPQVLDWLAANPVDVLALQELKMADEKFPLAAFNEAGWQEQSGLDINYLNKKPEDIKNKLYDVVLCMEIIEHVEDVNFFIQSCINLLKPNGLIFFATLNKTIKSYVLAIIGAEYILRWLPIGTHEWDKFISPNDIINKVSKHFLTHVETKGVTFNPLKNKWKLSDDTDVNYMCYFKKT